MLWIWLLCRFESSLGSLEMVLLWLSYFFLLLDFELQLIFYFLLLIFLNHNPKICPIHYIRVYIFVASSYILSFHFYISWSFVDILISVYLLDIFIYIHDILRYCHIVCGRISSTMLRFLVCCHLFLSVLRLTSWFFNIFTI